MRTITLLFAATVLYNAAHAQTVANFTTPLPATDTYYVSYAALGSDVGFNDGLAHFPCYFDTSGGDTFWTGGFVYTNWQDSATSPGGYGADSVFYLDPGKECAAKTGIGYASADQYAAVNCVNPITGGDSTNLVLIDSAASHPVSGFYVTNTSYAYSSMKYGDEFDTAFQTGDWFLLTIKGYRFGTLTTDSVNFYLADYRSSNPDSQYILGTWQWVNLLPIGPTDSLQFSLSSSNNTGGYLDVPAYFCMDNFTTEETAPSYLGVHNMQPGYIAKVYPNPSSNVLYVDVTGNSVQQVSVMDVAGNVINTYAVSGGHLAINTGELAAGTYLLEFSGEGQTAITKFLKQ